MGILKVFLILGLGAFLCGGAPAFLGPQAPAMAAQEEEKKDDSSGRWEGVAMARLEVPSENNS
ncbi:MAG: hypothetical protein IT572_02765 [Deltaproteobacteria bacterium]|nr:hypothetical protein [Deltaproteobacteria bacterium]